MGALSQPVSPYILCEQALASLADVDAIPLRLGATTRYLTMMLNDPENHIALADHAVLINRACMRLAEEADECEYALRGIARQVRVQP
jgi:hypothetical protein